jgi:putative ABC transport system substrate-binding protein
MRRLISILSAVFGVIIFGLSGSPTLAADKVYRIGYLSATTAKRDAEANKAFHKALRDLGYEIGKTLLIEERYANGQYKKMSGLAAELLSSKPDAIVAAGPAAYYAGKATDTIPVVMRTADPVGIGLATSLTRPGGNVTGLSSFNADLVVKRLQLIKQAVPRVRRIAVLYWPRAGSSHQKQYLKLTEAAPALGVTLLPVALQGSKDFDRALSAVGDNEPDALIVFAAGKFENNRTRIIDTAARHRLPAIYAYGHWPEDGGLMSYGTDIAAMHSRLAVYVDKVLQGARPSDLPIEQPSRFSLAVNLETAKNLGIEIPRSILLRADKVLGNP